MNPLVLRYIEYTRSTSNPHSFKYWKSNIMSNPLDNKRMPLAKRYPGPYTCEGEDKKTVSEYEWHVFSSKTAEYPLRVYMNADKAADFLNQLWDEGFVQAFLIPCVLGTEQDANNIYPHPFLK